MLDIVGPGRERDNNIAIRAGGAIQTAAESSLGGARASPFGSWLGPAFNCTLAGSPSTFYPLARKLAKVQPGQLAF
jgi:hypothetical protein